MARIVIFILILCSSVFVALGAYCGNESWTRYDNQKCYRIMDQLVNREMADALCRTLVEGDGIVPEVLTVKNLAEQQYIRSYIYDKTDIFDSVWLGAERSFTGRFRWKNAPVVYSNWADGFPTNNTDQGCLQLSSKASRDQSDNDNGLWKDVPCNKRNLVVCQKQTTLAIAEIQSMLFDLKNNPVPVGFIYTELPNKPTPQSIWPALVWKNVSPEYAGLFFRAEGGDAGEFGTIQEESTKRLANVETLPNKIEDTWGNREISPGEWSKAQQVGFYIANNANRAEQIRFLVSKDEVKPRNTAVKFWERIQ